MVNDHFYKVDVMSGADGLDLASIEQRFWAVIDDAQGRPAGEGVGACSADERGTWTLAREHLLSLDPQNRSTLTAIEDALFVVALDAHTLKSDVYTSSSPVNKTPDLDAHIANACSGAGTGRNRWWDKAVSIVVESNGRGSMVGEHSPCDALIPSVIADYILAEGVDADATSKRGVKSEAVAFERLEWVLDAKAKENIGKAVETVKDLVTDSEGKMLWYDEYGADWIKKVGAFDFLTHSSFAVEILMFFQVRQVNNRLTLTCRWRCNSLIIKLITSPLRLTRRRLLVRSFTVERKSFDRLAQIVGSGSMRCETGNIACVESNRNS